MTNPELDTIRLNRLSDPKFEFRCAITADGKAKLVDPRPAMFDNYRSAIDYARCCNGELPFCIKCKQHLTEQHIENQSREINEPRRFSCPKCQTTFNEEKMI